MDQNLTYQKARRIRGTKLTDLFTDQLLYEPSIGKAIGKTISLKAQSKIKGIKEKFDPLNIAKFLTFGSNIGPALYGKLAGRDPRDIQYFTGRYSPIRVGGTKGTASKITPTPGQGGDIDGINEQLLKIYNFLKSSYEIDNKRKQQEQNFKEEKEIEKERRHKEFIEALTKLKRGKTTASAVSKAEEKEGFDFGGLVEGIISKIKDMISGMIDAALDAYKWVKNLTVLKDLVSYVPRILSLLGWFATPLGVALLAATSAGALLAYLGNKQKEEIEANPYDPKFKDNAYAMVLRGEAKSVGEATQMNIAKTIKTFRRNEVESFVNSPLSDAELVEEFGTDRVGLKKWLYENPSKGAVYQAPVRGMNVQTSSATAMPNETDAETARLSRQNAAAAPKIETKIEAPSVETPKATMVPVSANEQLNTVMSENVAANLPAKPSNEAQSVINNLIQNRASRQQELARLDEIAVHNDEPTFMRMIMDSTRLV